MLLFLSENSSFFSTVFFKTNTRCTSYKKVMVVRANTDATY
jgi:hypothetical protein